MNQPASIGISRLPAAAAILILMLLSAASGQAASVGPDRFGYVATDAAVYSFADISSSGVGILAGADDDAAAVNIGFSFPFYGRSFTSVCVSANGLLAFGGCYSGFANLDLTTAALPGNPAVIAPFWTDLTFARPGSGAVHYQTLGVPPNRRFIVQWTNAYPINAPQPVTFQVILFESGHRILFQYRDVDAGAGIPASLGGRATVGIRDIDGHSSGRRLQWSCNAPVLRNSLAIEFSPAGLAPVDLGEAGPQHWALLVVGRNSSAGLSGRVAVTGSASHVGVASGGRVSISGSATIHGALWLGATAKLDQSGGTIAGGVLQGDAVDAKINKAAAEALAASEAAARLPSTMPSITSITIANPSQSFTIQAMPGRNVLNLTDLVITRGTLTLAGPPGATFVINISKKFEISGDSSIQTEGGIMPLGILFNATGQGEVSISGGSAGGVPRAQVSGIILAPARSVSLAPSLIVGEVIAGGAKVALQGEGRIHNPL